MAARKLSGAERNSGKFLMRSSISSGMPWIVDAVNGDGRTGLDGFDSELNVLISERASGIGVAFALVAKAVPPALVLWRRMIQCVTSKRRRRRSKLPCIWESTDDSVASLGECASTSYLSLQSRIVCWGG